MKLKTKITNKLSTKLLGFLPILKAGVDELFEEIKEISKENPYIEVRNKRFVTVSNLKNANADEIEALTLSEETLYESLLKQIEDSNLFPTKRSKDIALEIIEDINNEGFFEGDEKEIAKRLGVDEEKVKRVRERFMYLNPAGVGAKDLKECMIFQLQNIDMPEDVYKLASEMITYLENIDKFVNEPKYKEAMKIIKQLNVVPAMEYIKDEEIIPEIIVLNIDGQLEIRINDEHYPEINVKDPENKNSFSKEKFKEARNIVDALEMRKATLKKIALMIVELQYEFFQGGVIKPMKIKDLADELEYAPSTISRAISNKYLLCDRGIIPLKNFFSIALDEDTSSNQIKEEIKNLIKNEDKNKPLSDDKLTEIINQKYNLNLVRRTISKYRDQLKIPTSRERKRIYKVGGEISF
ncbi:RNA polymerase sigma-54 factor [Nautilia profundicola AmH]|uniref:RNA polymerase sigma-54 factor n=1 Tax=Nautilia profundicola (strain ATCC BAA-1463 / DSM 18972 / AmH) TaxID=598659 RepID=B9L984_NAUPA|nr:RNA polymerase factor sigma-54 [Nautilia profundicola]ACM92561.1 RNA polymerase sigma-54 factor [Nautilia profundicola AmH]